MYLQKGSILLEMDQPIENQQTEIFQWKKKSVYRKHCMEAAPMGRQHLKFQGDTLSDV
jgi:hypothetical protein